MAVLATQQIVGNIGKVYEPREVGEQKREVIDFTVAVTPRKKVNDEWVDGDTYWVNVTAWGKLAVNVKESFASGDRVIIIGRTDMKAGYTNKSGEEVPPRPIVVADFAGLEVSNHSAHSTRKSGGGSAANGAQTARPTQNRPAQQQKPAPAADDFDFDSPEFGDDTPF
jgi:single-strand DNA-binding protein